MACKDVLHGGERFDHVVMHKGHIFQKQETLESRPQHRQLILRTASKATPSILAPTQKGDGAGKSHP
eukprot:2579532-Amphidinium_carterae.1